MDKAYKKIKKNMRDKCKDILNLFSRLEDILKYARMCVGKTYHDVKNNIHHMVYNLSRYCIIIY